MKTLTDEYLNQTLNKLFDPGTYQGHLWTDQYKVAGLNLIDEINQLDPDLVIDAGCAHNRFKGHIKNLIGFDRACFPFADLHMKIEDAAFRSESADVVLALGSMHFGSKELVEQQLDNVISWVKPGGFIVMRVNHTPTNSTVNIRFQWTNQIIEYFTKKHNLIMYQLPVKDHKYTRNDAVEERLVWWWKKPGNRKKYKIDPVSCLISER